MKKTLTIIVAVVAVLIIAVVFILAWMGFVPGLSKVLGADKPKDLGVSYTKEDLNSALSKNGIAYETLPATTPDSSSIQFSGKHDVNTSWNSAEMTALLNNGPWKYWPISNAQLKINNDGTAEMSGVLSREKLSGYSAAMGVPSAVSDRYSLLPSESAFYVKGKLAAVNNQISQFDISSVELGHMPIPPSILLSVAPKGLVQPVYAQTVTGELSKYSGKKAAIVNFINGRMAWISGFFAKKADFSNGKLNFEGSMPDKELTVR